MKAKYVEERWPRLMLMGYYGVLELFYENLTTVDDRFNVRNPELSWSTRRQNAH